MSKTVLSKIGALLLPLIFSVFCAFPSFAQTENTVTIQAKDIALEKVMQQIEKQTRCVFLNKDVDVKENVSVNISGKTLSETLNILFKDKNIDWKIESGHIIISKKAAQSKAAEGKATTSQISGVVIDEEGVPVIGVVSSFRAPPSEQVPTSTEISHLYCQREWRTLLLSFPASATLLRYLR